MTTFELNPPSTFELYQPAVNNTLAQEAAGQLALREANNPFMAQPDDTLHWKEQAACLGKDTEMFYEEKGRPSRASEAKAICAKCPVRDECREDALDTGDFHGIRGGLGPLELKHLAVMSNRF